jgi:hypothetical protein
VAEVSERPATAPAQAVAVSGGMPEFKPKSFLELLEASLGLGD